ncbi:MAG: YibE/F family protein [Chloroflexota bacterium]
MATVAALALLLFGLRLTSPPVPPAPVSPDAPSRAPEEILEGVVLAAELLPPPPDATTTQTGSALAPATALSVRITRGSQRDRVVRLELGGGSVPNIATAARSYAPGDRVVVAYAPDLDQAEGAPASTGDGAANGDGVAAGGGAAAGAFHVVDHVRWPWLWWGAALFAIAVLAVAGGQGARALIALLVAVGVLWWFVIPRLLAGQPPIPVALAGCALIAVPALLVTNGLGRESVVPLGGVAGSLVLVGLLTVAAAHLARLSGLATSEELSLVYVGTQGAVDPQGLLLAGMLIGAVGGLIDVTVGQAAAVFEFHDADPDLSRGALFRRGMNVGRAHVAAAVHTLVLAYAGAALPLLMLFAMYAGSLGDVWNRELIASEVLRSVGGGVGLAAAMPLTTWLACLGCRRPARPARATPAAPDAAASPARSSNGTEGRSSREILLH